MNTMTPANPQVGPATVNRLGRLGHWCAQRRRAVLATWLAALVIITALSFVFHGIFLNKFGGSSTESSRAQRLLGQRFPSQAGDEAQVVFQTTGSVTSPAVRAAITADLAGLSGLAHVASVNSPFTSGGQISPNGHIAYGIVQFDQQTATLPKAAIKSVVDKATHNAGPGITVVLGGSPIRSEERRVGKECRYR